MEDDYYKFEFKLMKKAAHQKPGNLARNHTYASSKNISQECEMLLAAQHRRL